MTRGKNDNDNNDNNKMYDNNGNKQMNDDNNNNHNFVKNVFDSVINFQIKRVVRR